jgi:hypothetical protein
MPDTLMFFSKASTASPTPGVASVWAWMCAAILMNARASKGPIRPVKHPKNLKEMNGTGHI